MHKLLEYICEELEELERKAEKDGNLSMAEIQYADTLAHTKKNLLKSEEMMDGESYGMGDGSYRMGSYARGRRRGRTGANQYGSYARDGHYMEGYSRNDGMIAELRELMMEAPDERSRKEFQKFISKMESM